MKQPAKQSIPKRRRPTPADENGANKIHQDRVHCNIPTDNSRPSTSFLTPKPTCGLVNYDNSCYINSCVQMMFNLKISPTHVNQGIPTKRVLQSHINLITEMSKESSSLVVSRICDFQREIRNLCRHSPNTQQDSQEALETYLQVFCEHSQPSDISFRFQIHKHLRCLYCQHEYVGQDPDFPSCFLVLPISDNEFDNVLESCVERYFRQPEPTLTCLECNNLYTTEWIRYFVTPPQILFIKLNRLDLDRHRSHGVHFNTAKVYVNEVLNVGSSSYSLNSIICHEGNDYQSGHYYAIIKHETKWFECNDNVIREIPSISDDRFTKGVYVLAYTKNNLSETANT